MERGGERWGDPHSKRNIWGRMLSVLPTVLWVTCDRQVSARSPKGWEVGNDYSIRVIQPRKGALRERGRGREKHDYIPISARMSMWGLGMAHIQGITCDRQGSAWSGE